MSSRSFSPESSKRPHLIRAHGLGAEVRDLREDVDRAFERLEDQVDVHSPPQEIHGWDGTLRTITLLQAPHGQSLYEALLAGTILSNDGNGFYTVTLHWKDPDIGALSFVSDNITVLGEPGIVTTFSKIVVSNGDEPITLDIQGFGTWPTAGVSVYSSIARLAIGWTTST